MRDHSRFASFFSLAFIVAICVAGLHCAAPVASLPRSAAPACEVARSQSSAAELGALALPLTPRRRSRSGQRPASSRGRTWRPALRPNRGIRPGILAAGRGSKTPPRGSGAPPGRPPSAPSKPLGQGITEESVSWIFSQFRYVVAIVTNLSVAPADAEDVAQEALVTALRFWHTRRSEPSDPNDAGARIEWINTIARRKAADYHAAIKRSPPMMRDITLDEAEHIETDARAPSLEGPTEARSALGALQRATTPERWQVWLAHDGEGVTAAAIAKDESLPIGTVYNRLRLAREDIAAALARETIPLRPVTTRVRQATAASRKRARKPKKKG